MNAVCTIPISSLEQMLRDPSPSARRAALHHWRQHLATTNVDQVCAFLWSAGTLDEFEATALATAALDDQRLKVRKMARLTLRCLHPLLGIPARMDVRERPLAPLPKMREWLSPRNVFETTIADMLSTPETDRMNLVESLGEFDGEQSRVTDLLRRLADQSCLDCYRKVRARRLATVSQLIISLTQRCSRSCGYCYVPPETRRSGEEVPWAPLLATLDWAQANGIRRISFTGGEPTEYSRFADLVREVSRRGLRTYLNTHGLLTPEALNALQSPAVTRVGIHVGPSESYGTESLAHLRECVRILAASGAELFIRFTQLNVAHKDTEWLLRLAADLSIRHINWAYAFPTPSRDNRYLPLPHLVLVKPSLLELLSLATEHGICVRLAKPLPLCLFSRVEYAHHRRQHELTSTCTVHENHGIHNLVVQPDGRVLPCVGVPVPGPILIQHQLDPLRAHCRTQIAGALQRLQVDCGDCALLPLGVCQRACLAYGITATCDSEREVAS